MRPSFKKHLPRRRLWAGLVLAVLLGLTGCRSGRPGNTAVRPLRVAAAGNLAPLMPDLLAAFTAQTGLPAVPVIASSGKLAQQIIAGAPYDVFLAADAQYVDDLIRQGFIVPDSRRVYARGVLVLVVRQDAPAKVRGLGDLTIPAIRRIAVANPEHAPYGRAAQEALQHAGLWEAVHSRLVFGDTVRQAMQFVQSGNAPVGLVALSVAQGDRKVHIIPIPAGLYTPLLQTAGIVARSSRRKAARQFLAFLESPAAGAIFHRYGYGPPPADPRP